ncbi:MAG: metal-dependent transcriptional regulator [Bacillota bacterium]
MTGTIVLTSALEDYLEVMLELGEKESEIKVTDVADRLNIAKSTVSQTINKLRKMGLVNQESYGPIELTRIGKEHALNVRKRHRLLRKFLVEVLEIDYETAEKDACLMEHVVSSKTMEKMAEYIANAGVKEIYPTAENEETRENEERPLRSLNTKNLSELKPGDKGKIIRIAARGTVKRRLLDMGITTGSEVAVLRVAPLGDPLEIMVRGYNLCLRKDEAASIFVEVHQ